MPASANPPSIPHRLLVIANPISGGGRARAAVPALCDHLRRRGIHAEGFFTERAGHAAERATQAADEDWDGLVAAGGDGTINEVFNGMPDPTRPLGFLPVGTANVLALEYGLPRDPARAADVLAAGRLTDHTFGVTDTGRRFLLFVGAGVDGAVVRRLSEVRTGTLGKHKWLGPILHTVRRWPRFDLGVTLDGNRVLSGLSSVLVTRTRHFGGVVRLTPGIRGDDGQLHVLAFRMRSRTSWLWHGLRAYCGRLRAGPHLEVTTARTIAITGNAPFQVDGDHGGDTPMTITSGERPARLFGPRPAPSTH